MLLFAPILSINILKNIYFFWDAPCISLARRIPPSRDSANGRISDFQPSSSSALRITSGISDYIIRLKRPVQKHLEFLLNKVDERGLNRWFLRLNENKLDSPRVHIASNDITYRPNANSNTLVFAAGPLPTHFTLDHVKFDRKKKTYQKYRTFKCS